MNWAALNIQKTLAAPRSTLDFVLPNLLAGAVGSLVAPGGSGKTMLLTELAAALAVGLAPGGGLFPQQPPVKVALLAAEEYADILVHRLMDVAHVHCASGRAGGLSSESYREQLAKRLLVYPLAGEDVLLLRGGEYTEALDGLTRLAAGCRLLIVDPLRRFHDADENDAAVMTRLVQGLEGVGKRTGCAVLLAHHASKWTVLAGRGGVQQSSRGSSALTDAVRWQANLSPMDLAQAKALGIKPAQRGEYVQFAVTKANHGATPDPVWLRRSTGGVLLCADLSGPAAPRGPRYARKALQRV